MEFALKTPGNKTEGKIQLDDNTFAQPYNQPLVHQVVVAYQAGGRAGTKASKSRSDVRGGGAKPWKQKGTGNARAGTIRSPLWEGGGVTFAHRPRDYSQKVNKKMYRAAIRSILSELARTDRLILVNNLQVSTPKTKDLVGLLKGLQAEKCLIVTEAVNESLYLACRNIPYCDVIDVVGIDPVSLIRAKKIVLTEAAAKLLEERFA